VHNINDVRQTKIHRAEPLVPGPSHAEFVTAGKFSSALPVAS
jgi:hypothetical protein